MYAETFNVRAWLEEPAKWLRWAQQSLAKRNLDNTRYNLQQFWGSLTTFKGKASQPLEWGEILTLDAQSQILLGNLYGAEINALLQSMNNTKLVSSSVYALKEDDYSAKQRALTAGRDKALEASKTLAAQAEKAYQDAQATGPRQSANTLQVATNSKGRAAGETTLENQIRNSIEKGVSLEELLLNEFMGVPGWAWAAGGLLLLVLIASGPAMARTTVLHTVEDR